MSNRFAVAALLSMSVGLSACAAPWEKPGVSPAAAEAAYDRCYEKANARYLAGRHSFDTSAAIRETGRLDYQRVLSDRCMQAQGYRVTAGNELRLLQDQDSLQPFRNRPGLAAPGAR